VVLGNAFGWIADWERAQKLADHFSVKMVHRKLNEFVERYGPVVEQFGLSYHGAWTKSSSPPMSCLPSRPTGRPSMTDSPELPGRR